MKTKILAAGIASLFLTACGTPPDLSAVKAELGKSLHRYDIVESLASNGKVIVGGTQSGAALVSSDAGKTWTREALGPVSMIGLSVCPDGSFLGIDFYHKVWTADAQGAGWKAAALEKPRVPLTVTCDGKGRWWVAGSGAKIAVSSDKGATWTLTDLKEDAQFTTLQMVDDKFGIAMGEFGMVVTTQDGGQTWAKGPSIAGEFYPYASLFVNGKEGWASGLAGQILHTTDSGKTWNKDSNATGAALYRLFLQDGKPVGVGAGGIVARYESGTWKAIAYPDAAPVFLGAGTATGPHSLALGGPGGLVRVIDTAKN